MYIVASENILLCNYSPLFHIFFIQQTEIFLYYSTIDIYAAVSGRINFNVVYFSKINSNARDTFACRATHLYSLEYRAEKKLVDIDFPVFLFDDLSPRSYITRTSCISHGRFLDLSERERGGGWWAIRVERRDEEDDYRAGRAGGMGRGGEGGVMSSVFA